MNLDETAFRARNDRNLCDFYKIFEKSWKWSWKTSFSKSRFLALFLRFWRPVLNDLKHLNSNQYRRPKILSIGTIHHKHYVQQQLPSNLEIFEKKLFFRFFEKKCHVPKNLCAHQQYFARAKNLSKHERDMCAPPKFVFDIARIFHIMARILKKIDTYFWDYHFCTSVLERQKIENARPRAK